MIKVKNMIKIILFCGVGIVLFFLVQRIFTPDHNMTNIRYSIEGFNKLEDNSLDAVFLGPSHTLLSVYPMDIYKQTGAKAYNFSTAGQPISLSYELLKKVFKNQVPKIVILNAGNLIYEDGEANERFRFYTENIPLSIEKIEIAHNYTQYGFTDGSMSILFPIIKYHERWTELNDDDFKRISLVGNDYDYFYTMGAFVMDFSLGTALTSEQSDIIINEMLNRSTSEIKFRDETGEYQTKKIATPIRTIAISDNNKKILKQMKDLCDKNGCKFVLTTMPTRLDPTVSPNSAWGRDIHAKVSQLASDFNIEYLDFSYNINVGIDMITDTYDQGTHLNTLGARKITNYFCKYFTEQGIVGTGGPVWDEQLVKWNKLMEIVDWQTDLDFHSYLNKLIENKDKLDIFISASTTYSDALTAEEIQMFKQLGLTLVGDGGFCDSYAAIVSGGDVKYEAVSPRKITYNTTLDDGTKVNLVSSGWYTGSQVSIEIDGAEYSSNGECLNFVIRERETGMVIDSVRFATRYPEKTAYHTRQWSLIENYQTMLCQH